MRETGREGNLTRWLEARGLRVREPGGASQGHAPAGQGLLCGGLQGEALTAFYRLMRRYSFRILLREILRRRGVFSREDVQRYGSHGSTERYLATLRKHGLVAEEGSNLSWQGELPDSLGPTLEWFVAEVLRKELSCEALFRVRLGGLRGGGDYDVVALWQGRIIYVETKSGPPKATEPVQVERFLDRVESLAPEVAIFLMDTHLRMSDKMVPLFREELARRCVPAAGGRGPSGVGRGVYHIGDRVFISNSKRGIRVHILACLWWYLRHCVGAMSDHSRSGA
jgi:hypothetical protein